MMVSLKHQQIPTAKGVKSPNLLQDVSKTTEPPILMLLSHYSLDC